MDKFIELVASYWIEWQQLALTNTLYSLTIAALSFFIGGFIVSTLKGIKISRLRKQNIKKQQLLDNAKKQHKDFLNQQKFDTDQIAGLERQLEKASSSLLNEKVEFQSVVFNKEELFVKSSHKKQLKIDTIKSELDKKNQLIEKLQKDLDNNKKTVPLLSEKQVKPSIVEKKQEEKHSPTKIEIVKQPLKTKPELIIKDAPVKQSAPNEIDPVKTNEAIELEQKIDHSLKTKKTQQQNQQSKKPDIIEASNINLKQAPTPKIDNTNKPQVNLNQPAKQPIPTPVKTAENLRKKAPAPTMTKRPLPVNNTANKIEGDYSDKIADLADMMDSFQDKIKGIFSKK